MLVCRRNRFPFQVRRLPEASRRLRAYFRLIHRVFQPGCARPRIPEYNRQKSGISTFFDDVNIFFHNTSAQDYTKIFIKCHLIFLSLVCEFRDGFGERRLLDGFGYVFLKTGGKRLKLSRSRTYAVKAAAGTSPPCSGARSRILPISA